MGTVSSYGDDDRSHRDDGVGEKEVISSLALVIPGAFPRRLRLAYRESTMSDILRSDMGR